MTENRNHAESPAEPGSPTEALGSTGSDTTADHNRPSIMEAANMLEAETRTARETSDAGSPSWYEESLRDEAALRSEPATVPAPSVASQPPAAGYSPGAPAPRERTRVGTIVWGLVLVLLGVAVVAIGLGFELDLEVFLIGLLGIAGVGLLVGTAISALRGR